MYTIDSMSDKTSESAAVCQYFMSLLKGGGVMYANECER